MVFKKLPNVNLRTPSADLKIDLYTITHSPEFLRGAKREIRDDDGKLLISERTMSISFPGTYTKMEAEEIKQKLIEFGLKNIKLHQQTIDVPSKCPSCKREGIPALRKDIRKEIHKKKDRLVYGHSTKPKTCYVGTYELQTHDFPNRSLNKIRKKRVPTIMLKNGLPLDSLGFKRRVGTYPLQ